VHEVSGKRGEFCAGAKRGSVQGAENGATGKPERLSGLESVWSAGAKSNSVIVVIDADENLVGGKCRLHLLSTANDSDARRAD
jgi:hypothetical protein